jgi:hypothetical protein
MCGNRLMRWAFILINSPVITSFPEDTAGA